jgi:hypothetical protein
MSGEEQVRIPIAQDRGWGRSGPWAVGMEMSQKLSSAADREHNSVCNGDFFRAASSPGPVSLFIQAASAKSLHSWLGYHLVPAKRITAILNKPDMVTKSPLFESNRRAGFAEPR